MSDNVNKARVLYLSYFFKRNRESYYDLLQQVRDEGDWETWLRFFLQSIVEVAQEATSTARRIVQLREKHRNLIMNEFGRAASSGFKLLEYL